MTTDSFHISVIGARHIQEGLPCQDYAASICEGDVAVAIACDGHGADMFFRSDIGAKLAAQAALEGIKDFMSKVDRSSLIGKPYAAFNLSEGTEKNGAVPEMVQRFRPLFVAIHGSWVKKVSQHISANPFTEEELRRVPEVYLPYYDNVAVAASAYGTTLIAYAQCKDFWLAFQIGDGKMIVFQDDNCCLPIPDDAQCRDNLTTSLCDPHAVDEFRFCVDGSGAFPSAVFVCTDGMEKCFLSEESLGEYLYKMSRVLELGSKDVLIGQMEDLLPKFSKITSGDDISIACVYNLSKKMM